MTSKAPQILVQLGIIFMIPFMADFRSICLKFHFISMKIVLVCSEDCTQEQFSCKFPACIKYSNTLLYLIHAENYDGDEL